LKGLGLFEIWICGFLKHFQPCLSSIGEMQQAASILCLAALLLLLQLTSVDARGRVLLHFVIFPFPFAPCERASSFWLSFVLISAPYCFVALSLLLV
jgi:hypothetical protein